MIILNNSICYRFQKQLLLQDKVTATNMRYFAKSKPSRSLVYKKHFSLIGKVIFKLEQLILSREVGYLNELG